MRRKCAKCAAGYRTMLLTVRFISGICYLGWLVTSICGQDEWEKTFSSGNPWPNGISQAENMTHFVNHSLAQCGLKCLTALSCQAFTYEENNHPICSLHDKLLEIDHHHPVSKPKAKYFQRDGKACGEYLISGNKIKIPSIAFTASSKHSCCPASASRLNSETFPAAWCAAHRTTPNQWINIDLGVQMMITGVVTQGRQLQSYTEWVTSYSISHSINGIQFKAYREVTGIDKVFPGNVDRNSHVTHQLKFPILARHVRLHPLEWHDWVCLRLDVFGCEA